MQNYLASSNRIIVVTLALLIVFGVAGYSIWDYLRLDNTDNKLIEKTSDDEVRIKSLAINLDYYDPETNMAGDLVFTQDSFPEETVPALFTDYGTEVAGNSANNWQSRLNPQPTFIAPLGTEVHALIDGEVVAIPQLYSGDYSIHMQGKGSDLIFETEHVINLKVQIGDKVKAGDVIAEVRDYDAINYHGLGLVEIGILKGGNPPQHLCPFAYLDESIKDDTLSKITDLKKSWEEYRGDTTIYDESAEVIPGCLTQSFIEG